jgi:hypothetical protein
MSSIAFVCENSLNNQVQLEGEKKQHPRGNYLNRLVEWIRADRPAYQKFLVYTAVAATSLAFIASIIGIPIVLQLAEEARKAALQDQVRYGDNKVYDAIGGPEKYKQLAELSSKIPLDETTTLKPSEMTHSLMRGAFTYDRPCIVMKLVDRFNGGKFVQVLHRKFIYEPTWDYTRGENTPFISHNIDDEALKIVRAIVNGTHRHYRLA